MPSNPPAAVGIPGAGASNSETARDVNDDGKVDLVVASENSGDGIYVLIGNDDRTFQSPVFYQQGSNSGADAIAIGQLIKGDQGEEGLGVVFFATE